MLDPNSNIPQIAIRAAPPEEHNDLQLLNGALQGVEGHLRKFTDALQLFDYCLVQTMAFGMGQSRFPSWCTVAARDASMTVYNLRNEMLAANTLANKSAYVGPKLDRTLLGESHAKFEEYFPDFAAIRHAVGHAGELAKNRAAFEKNAFSGNYEGESISVKDSQHVMIQNTLQNRLYTCTYDGKIVHCEISVQTLSRLHEVISVFFQAFRGQPATPVQSA